MQMKNTSRPTSQLAIYTDRGHIQRDGYMRTFKNAANECVQIAQDIFSAAGESNETADIATAVKSRIKTSLAKKQQQQQQRTKKKMVYPLLVLWNYRC